MIVSVYLKWTLEKLSGTYLLYIIEFRWMKADNWRPLLLSRAIVYARKTKRMCERKLRGYDAMDLFPIRMRERENAGSFPTFRCEWKCLRHAHTRARGNPRSVTNAFSFREPRSSRFRFNDLWWLSRICASFSHTERIRALQKTIVAFCFHASDTQSKVTWVFYTQIVISLLACFDDKVIA